MKLALIVNPHSGGGRAARSLEAVRAALHGVDHHVELTQSLDHARALARGAAAAGEVAVAFGGDGLIGAVAGALAIGEHSDGVLGVLPGGRGNDFARALGIPLEPVQACRTLIDGVERALDLGEVNGNTFIGIASCGFDSDANRIANETKLVRGNLVYAYGALRALLGWRPATFTLRFDGDRARTFTGYTVAAANSKAYGGGMLIAPDASLTDGQLDVVLVGDVPKLRFLRLLPTVFKGEHVDQPGVEVVRAAEITIEADRPFTIFADGDPIAELPATVRVLPAAVRVLAPGGPPRNVPPRIAARDDRPRPFRRNVPGRPTK
ncbi:MAG TPA: diacylglycerol kinase family protein [Solirubrobacteraceae bacterium]|nr:diacylglycerol kinase family protein [Solirubrobacteraceae bacterium]